MPSNMPNVGSRAMVLKGKAAATKNGLTMKNLTRNSKGRIVAKSVRAAQLSKRRASTIKKLGRGAMTRSRSAAAHKVRVEAGKKAAAKRLATIMEGGWGW